MSGCECEIENGAAGVISGKEAVATDDCSLEGRTEEAVGGCCMVGISAGSE